MIRWRRDFRFEAWQADLRWQRSLRGRGIGRRVSKSRGPSPGARSRFQAESGNADAVYPGKEHFPCHDAVHPAVLLLPGANLAGIRWPGTGAGSHGGPKRPALTGWRRVVTGITSRGRGLSIGLRSRLRRGFACQLARLGWCAGRACRPVLTQGCSHLHHDAGRGSRPNRIADAALDTSAGPRQSDIDSVLWVPGPPRAG